MVVRVFVLCVGLIAAITPAAAQSSVQPTIEDLAALRELGAPSGGLALSPDGRWLATFEARTDVARNVVQYELLLLPAHSAAIPRVIGDGGGLILHDDEQGRRTGALVERIPRWSPDSRWIAYIAERDGRVELWRSDTNGRRQRLLNAAGDVRDFAWASKSRLVIRTATPRTELARQRAAQIDYGFRVDEHFSAAFSLLPNPDITSGAAIVALDVGTGRTSLASEAESALLGTRPLSQARIAPRDPASRAATPPLGLFVQASGPERMCDHPECDGRLRETGVLANGEVWFTRLEGVGDRDQGLYVWTPGTRSVRMLRRADERLNSCGATLTQIICIQEFGPQPKRIVAIDSATGDLSVVYEPNLQWARFALPRIEQLEFVDRQGLESYAHLVFPYGYQPGRAYPMVIVQYRSRGFLRGGTGGEYPIFPLAARGYFVMSVARPEPVARSREISRADLDRELNVGVEEERMKLDSLDGLIAQVVGRGLVDNDRIAITGMSDGAETLFWMLRRRRFAAAVSSSPPADPSHWTMAESDVRDSMRALGISGPWPDDTDPWWRHNAPIFYARDLNTPLMMNLPESEAIHALPLAVRLRELSVPVESYIYPGTYHLKWRPSALLSAQRRAMAWIDFWLQGRETADPGDPTRIERWRAMRDAVVAGSGDHAQR